MMRSMLLLSALLAAACFSAATENQRGLDELRNRTAFDFRCDADSLNFTPLKEGHNGVVVQYGVEGCEQRAVYVRTPSGWVLDVADERASKK